VIRQDDELDKLEEDIRRVKSRYDQFFLGIQRVPPMQERRNLEVYIYELGKDKIRDNARRFRFNQLLTRYNQYRELWGRKMREREEGPLDFRRRQAAMNAPAHEAPPSPLIPRVTSPAPDPYVRMTPGANGEQIRELYTKIIRAHDEMGKMANLSIEQVATMVQKQTEIVRAKYNVNTVAFRVETVDGKVKLKAKPLQD